MKEKKNNSIIKSALQEDLERLKKKDTTDKEDNRISLKTKEEIEKERKKPFFKKFLERLSKDKNLEVDKENKEEKNYVIIRKEVDDLAPLYKLSMLDKIKVTLKYFDKKKGKTEKRIADAKRRQDFKNLKTDSAIKKKITEIVEPILEGKIKEVVLEIKTQKYDRDRIDFVLKGNYFKNFIIEEIKINPNYEKYNSNIPRVFIFKNR